MRLSKATTNKVRKKVKHIASKYGVPFLALFGFVYLLGISVTLLYYIPGIAAIILGSIIHNLISLVKLIATLF